MEAARIIAEPIAVDAQLHAFGLDRGELREVLEAARWGRENSTEYDVPWFAGWMQYGLGTRSIRMVLMESRSGEAKWSMSNRGGLCRTISPDGSMAIVVSSGTKAVGDPLKNPKTLNPKGKRSIEGLRVNRTQLELFGQESSPKHPWLWFLLVSVRNGEVFGELSMPIDVDDNGRASEWLTRIILGPDDIGGGGRDRREDDDLDIDVVRRAG